MDHFYLRVTTSEDAVDRIYQLRCGGKVIREIRSSSTEIKFALPKTGYYRVVASRVGDSASHTLSSDVVHFTDKAEPRIIQTSRPVIVHGVSRLGHAVTELLTQTGIVEAVTSSASDLVGGTSCGHVILEPKQVSEPRKYVWLLCSGVDDELIRYLNSHLVEYVYCTLSDVTPLHSYLRPLSLEDLLAIAHAAFETGDLVLAELVKRHIRQRFDSVLPYEVDFSGVKFSYGCLNVVINSRTTFGQGVTVGQGVTIGARSGRVPSVGSNVWIGPNALILGANVGDDAVIGGGAVVTKDIPKGEVVVAAKLRRI